MLLALRNNALWLLLMVPGTIAGGLFFALLADRVRYESIAKAIIFMPTAISFIGAGVIWRFVYDIETGGGAQIGVLNAIIVGLGGQPVTWLSDPAINNFSLMLVGVWLWAGFCMTILSAAIKGVIGRNAGGLSRGWCQRMAGLHQDPLPFHHIEPRRRDDHAWPSSF